MRYHTRFTFKLFYLFRVDNLSPRNDLMYSFLLHTQARSYSLPSFSSMRSLNAGDQAQQDRRRQRGQDGGLGLTPEDLYRTMTAARLSYVHVECADAHHGATGGKRRKMTPYFTWARRNKKGTSRHSFRTRMRSRCQSSRLDAACSLIERRLAEDPGKVFVFCPFLCALDIWNLDCWKLTCLPYDITAHYPRVRQRAEGKREKIGVIEPRDFVSQTQLQKMRGWRISGGALTPATMQPDNATWRMPLGRRCIPRQPLVNHGRWVCYCGV